MLAAWTLFIEARAIVKRIDPPRRRTLVARKLEELLETRRGR
jgi:hypothetical protein